MTYLLLISKHWRECIIALLAFLLLLCLIIIQHKDSKLIQAENDHIAYVNNQDLLLAQAQTEAKQKEKEYIQQQLKAEQNYNAKIKQIQSDASIAQSNADSLSKQLASAKQRLSAATRETIIEYTNASNDILESCIGQYRDMAQRADEHAVDAERLTNAWPH